MIPQNWEPWGRAVIPRSGDVAIDCGANVGYYTFPMAARFRKVFALEPLHDVAEKLEANLEPFDNVEILTVAAFDFAGMSDFAAENGMVVYDNGRADMKLLPRTLFPTIRLDDLAIDGSVDFIKMDIEGSELRALMGADRILREHGPRILVEVHKMEDRDPIERLLSGHGYRFAQLDAHERKPPTPIWLVADRE